MRDEPTAEADEGKSGELTLLAMVVGGVELALPARAVSAVSAITEPTPLPGAPAHILGLVATGDQVLPLVDLAGFLDLGHGEGEENIDSPAAAPDERPMQDGPALLHKLSDQNARMQDRPGFPAIDPMFRRALIVRAGELEAGLVCDRARGVITVSQAALLPPSVLQGDRLRSFLTAEVEAGARIVGVLDPEALLDAAAIR